MSSSKTGLVETVGTAKSGNMLIWGDCLASCAFLKEQIERGKMPLVDLVYIDPPFASGLAYGTRAYFRPNPSEGAQAAGGYEARSIALPVFDDVWARDDWSAWMRKNLLAIKQVMAPHASLYVQQDYHASAYMRILLDEVFGEEAFRSEIIWMRRGMDFGETSFKSAHETIFHYALSPDAAFHTSESVTDVWTDIEGLYDVNLARGNYATQKPDELLERIICASSEEGMLVADFFGGSGVCAAMSAKLGRAFVHADANIRSIQTARQRLREIGGLSFDVCHAEGADTPSNPQSNAERCDEDEVTVSVEQVERAGRTMWRTTILRSKFAAFERELAQLNVRRHLASIFSGGEIPTPIQVSDSSLELVECASLDCSYSEGAWHADAEVFIDRAGLVVEDGHATGQRWDACVYSDLPPKRVRVRSIRGDELTRRL